MLINFTDHRIRRLLKELANVQEEIDRNARILLENKKSEASLEDLLDELERLINIFDACADYASKPITKAVKTMVTYYRKWGRATLGSDEERDFATKFLNSIDKLHKVAS